MRVLRIWLSAYEEHGLDNCASSRGRDALARAQVLLVAGRRPYRSRLACAQAAASAIVERLASIRTQSSRGTYPAPSLHVLAIYLELGPMGRLSLATRAWEDILFPAHTPNCVRGHVPRHWCVVPRRSRVRGFARPSIPRKIQTSDLPRGRPHHAVRLSDDYRARGSNTRPSPRQLRDRRPGRALCGGLTSPAEPGRLSSDARSASRSASDARDSRVCS